VIQIEASSTNVYADIESVDASDMLIKARLAARIGQDIQKRGLTQSQAAELLGISRPKLSGMLRGQFRGISESKMLDCLALLGHRVQIVISEQAFKPSPVELVFA
jgi:predicted XRE-type DNA-binding protein